MKRWAGFTLIEVLVALSIVAIALVAGAQATAALTNNAQRQADVLLGHMCAENELARLRLARQLPGVGDNESTCEQAGRVYQLRVTVSPTPNPSFRRIDAQVFDGSTPILRLSTIRGRY
ncbi:type II secretion system minor pseudopilin GspI [Ramlibacter terrae]|uniref:Type II secretion system protein I n=1 Tax=Ramlibacter terrae TaxID=2732511 RepID=A0ABX6P5T9_9BURK|nr:type II secretion system minor pseudopilin GspI [Ramlibacter terrae]